MTQTPPEDTSQGASTTNISRKSNRQHNIKRDQNRIVQSDNDVGPQPGGDATPNRASRNKKRRPSAAQKQNGVQSDRGENTSQGPQAKIKSERSGHTPAKPYKDSAYAGATFQQSPAASALPLPSMFSKSMPNNSSMSTLAEQKEQSIEPRPKMDGVEERRESTPLDFMFSAARQARETPNGHAASPARFLSPAVQSPAAGRSPAERAGVEFPFELGEEEVLSTAKSTPFHQRIAEVTPRSTSGGGRTLTEQERMDKTQALKEAMRISSQPTIDQPNPFNARNAPPRHSSNPSTPSYTQYNNPSNGYNFPSILPTSPVRNSFQQYGQPNGYQGYNNHHNHPPTSSNGSMRPPSSGLRNIYNPVDRAPLSPPASQVQDRRTSTTQSPAPARALNFAAIYGGSRPTSSSSNLDGQSEQKPSLDQGIEDLRRALNMPGLLQRQDN